MSPALDARQRAMLEEMGVRLFWPEPAAAAAASAVAPAGRAAPAVVPAAAAPVTRPAVVVARAPAPVQAPPAAEAEAGPVSVAGVELLQWDALQQAVTTCSACGLCEGRRAPVFGAGDRQADWLIVSEPPSEEEDAAGQPLVGTAGQLLDQMLAALRLERSRQVYLASVLKCKPPASRNPSPEELAACEPFLRRQVALLQPRVILAMGRFAVQSLLKSGEPPGRLRGRAHDYHGVPVVVTYHPVSLLRTPADKGKAWADLCLARALARGAA